MHLKSLTILGFKSFAERTSLSFQPGITCIVGPNGCGKSNVADAVRWVLGEQSAKALRGGEMADVIFNGTDARKPLAMAEVSLTLDDVDQDQLRAAGVELAYHEVTVTRRVFRDGGSEYFINRTPCRLKDIQQLFMGTGIGRTSYSIMAQGNITQILSSKPEDRRLVFEEAAGITKFKSQKREALRKLEYTEQNLLRVSDLIREVKRQIGSLQRQAGKARRYKQIQQELQHLDTQLTRHQFDVLQSEIQERHATVERLRQEIEQASAQVLQDESGLVRLREQLADLEHEINQAQQQSLELRNQAERHEHRIQFNEERLRELDSQRQTALADIAQAEDRRSATEQERANVASQLEASLRSLSQQQTTLHSRQQSLAQIESGLGTLQSNLRELQAQLFDAAQQLARVRNELNALDLQKQGNLVRLDKLSAEKIQLEEERSRLDQRLQEFTANVESERQIAQTRRHSVAEQQQRLQDLQRQLEEAGQNLDTLVQQQTGLRSRAGVLEQLQSEHEGYAPGALAALRQTGQVLGSLADRIRVPDPYVVAIETALGHHLQVVLTEQADTARTILSDLTTQKRGRASIVPLAFLSPDPDPAVAIPDAPVGQPALNVIQSDPAIQPLLRQLLSRTVLVPDLSTATEAWTQGLRDRDFVTLTGEILSRHGVYTGGYLNGSGSASGPASILGRKNQIAQLHTQLEDLQTRIAEASRLKGQLLSDQTATQAALQTDQNDLRTREVAIATHEGEVSALRNGLRILHQKIDTVVYEVQSLGQQADEASRKRAGLADLAAAAEDRERTLQRQLGDRTAELDALRQSRDTANAAVADIRVQLAAQEELTGSLRRQQAPLDHRLDELLQLVARRREAIDGFIQRQGQAAAEIEESRQLIESLRHQRDQLGLQTAALEARRDDLNADLSERETTLRQARQLLTNRQEHRATLEIELAQKQMGIENLRERIRQKYQLHLDDIRSECITITLAEQGPPKIQTLTPEEMAQAGVSTDWTAVAAQVATLEQRLLEMGPVNLVAIEEYEETEQRHQFLSRQYEDLVNAKTELHEVINRINTQTRTMFLETFEKIRENFSAMFTEVFGGGRADLRLVDEGDVLESGIDIVARPPGKQLQTISLLSGGEQTMTAVALLFAIYQVKPSPFCVLDELDAPLDESNINRFVRILQRFVPHSQFIIITHNKRTIGMADVLYGVTMQEHGVSRIVSVKFHKTDAPADHPPAPLVPLPSGPMVEDEEDAPHTREETFELEPAR